MKIAHIHWSLGTGGIETMLPDIANEQAKTNEVLLIIINNWVEPFILAKIDQNKVKVVILNRTPGSKNPWPVIRLNLLLIKFRPDIIHCHAYNQIKLIYYPFGYRIRTIHNTNNILSQKEYSRFNKLITISKAVYDETLNQGFESAIAENGIPISRIKHFKEKIFLDGKLHFIQVSRLDTEQKGQDILLKALAIAKAKGNFVMHFIGKGSDEEMLKRMVCNLHLEDCVIFEGLKDQTWIYENLCNFDLFIQPSRYEGFGLTVAEAIAAKVPVLVSNIEGPLEIIDGGRLGLHFENKNISDCAAKIIEFVNQGRNEKQVEEAYHYICEHYNVSITAKKYLEVYQSLLNNRE